MRVVHAASDPETSVTLLGQKLSMPILGAVVAGAKMNFRGIVSEEELATAFIAGAKPKCPVLCFQKRGHISSGHRDGFKAIVVIGAHSLQASGRAKPKGALFVHIKGLDPTGGKTKACCYVGF